MKLVLSLLAFVCSATAFAAPPQRINAAYSLSRNGQEIAEVTETFVQRKGKYEIESVTVAAGIYRVLTGDNIRLLSRGDVTRNGLRPRHFEHHRGKREDKKIIADFDWKRREATFRHDGKVETAPIPEGMQDRISLMYQFMFLSLKDAGLRLDLSNGKKVESYEFTNAGDEAVETRAGSFSASHWKRKRAPGDEGTEVWLAQDKFQFPVRILIEDERGNRLDQRLLRLSVQ